MDIVTHINKSLLNDGFIYLKQWSPSLNSLEIADQIGQVLNIEAMMPNTGIKTVQTLRPRSASCEHQNQYSGIYGLEEFPFHSDLAHWIKPPRYLMLRCINGTKHVVTNLLPLTSLESRLNRNDLKFSLVVPRRKRSEDCICPMPLKFKLDDTEGVRCDLAFLTPINDPARRIYQYMSTAVWDKEMISVCLEERGDTLVIDNWRVLHNRSRVPEGARSRELERVYLDNIWIKNNG